jgi:hypothetical protein
MFWIFFFFSLFSWKISDSSSDNRTKLLPALKIERVEYLNGCVRWLDLTFFFCTSLQWLKKKHKPALVEALEKVKAGNPFFSLISSCQFWSETKLTNPFCSYFKKKIKNCRAHAYGIHILAPNNITRTNLWYLHSGEYSSHLASLQ